MGTKRLGVARMHALLENLKREINLNGSTLQGIGGYSSSDAWGAVRPSFLPGIDRGVKSVAIGQMHGYGFEVLSRNGVPPAMKTVEDTINLKIYETVRLRIAGGNPGDWMAHCQTLNRR